MRQNVKVYRGTTKTLPVTITDEAGSLLTLQEGERIQFGVKAKPEDTELLIQKFIDTVTDGVATVELTPEDTAALKYGRYVYDIGLESGEDYFNIMPASPFVVMPNVTFLSVIGSVATKRSSTQMLYGTLYRGGDVVVVGGLPAPAEASVGQFIRVSGVDENGKVTETEGYTIPENSVSGEMLKTISITTAADGTVTMVNTLSNGVETIVITPDENGNPASVTVNGTAIPITWTAATTEETTEVETEVTTE